MCLEGQMVPRGGIAKFNEINYLRTGETPSPLVVSLSFSALVSHRMGVLDLPVCLYFKIGIGRADGS